MWFTAKSLYSFMAKIGYLIMKNDSTDQQRTKNIDFSLCKTETKTIVLQKQLEVIHKVGRFLPTGLLALKNLMLIVQI